MNLCVYSLIVSLVFLFSSGAAAAQRPFTPKDDVELALFEYAGRGASGGIVQYSPDMKYIAVVTERGRVDINGPEDTIWIFRTADVERFAAGAGQAPAPFPLVQVIGGKNGPLIEQVRWLTDSSGIAFTQLVK